MQKRKAQLAEVGWQVVSIVASGACGTKGATGVDRSVALNMQLVIARLFREPHLQFAWIGDGLLCGHEFATQFTPDVQMYALRLE